MGLKAPGNYSASIWINNFSICLWENPQTPHLPDFGIFEPVTKPPNQLFVSLETPGYLKEIKKSPWNIFKNIVFIKLGILNIHVLTVLEKTGAENGEYPPNKNLENLGYEINIYRTRKHEWNMFSIICLMNSREFLMIFQRNP